MRARSRSCPRRLVAGLVAAGTIEIAAGARDAVEDALRAVHHDGAGDALLQFSNSGSTDCSSHSNTQCVRGLTSGDAGWEIAGAPCAPAAAAAHAV